jgi:hypothetical protein
MLEGLLIYLTCSGISSLLVYALMQGSARNQDN